MMKRSRRTSNVTSKFDRNSSAIKSPRLPSTIKKAETTDMNSYSGKIGVSHSKKKEKPRASRNEDI